MSCARGAAVRLRLPRAVAARANRAGGLALEVHIRDQKGSATIPMSFIRPTATRSSGPAARSAAVSYWNGPTTNCAKYPYTPGHTMFIDTYTAGASFGYALGTPLTLGAYTQVWSQQLGFQSFWRDWRQYNALSAHQTTWGTVLTQVYPSVYVRTEIIVRNNGARRWVPIGGADSRWTAPDGMQWCYFA
jgi:hypothetical protein